ncbi:hypothetical protein EJ02DRAFT_465823 [Clathrospora elynae]|uniref:Uncharacterized protein n=1 Tax=Clathrospora elynae TaxID=706981 RepID=A0A6A5SPA7_9PLEO|nr:hypothetical protein EJ02DRAFT_465823 [Clathrospora elynae]
MRRHLHAGIRPKTAPPAPATRVPVWAIRYTVQTGPAAPSTAFCGIDSCQSGNCTRPSSPRSSPSLPWQTGNTTDGSCGGEKKYTCNVLFSNCCNKAGNYGSLDLDWGRMHRKLELVGQNLRNVVKIFMNSISTIFHKISLAPHTLFPTPNIQTFHSTQNRLNLPTVPHYSFSVRKHELRLTPPRKIHQLPPVPIQKSTLLSIHRISCPI